MAGAIAERSPIPIDQNVAATCKAPCPILDLPEGNHWFGPLFSNVFTEVGMSVGYG